MKNFKKLLLAGAAITAMSAALATSAMAADDFTATYADGTVTLTGVPAEVTSQDQVTMVVINGMDDVNPTEENLKQIGQEDGAADVFATIPVGELADGTYTVKLGGTAGKIYMDTFTVGDVDPEGMLGDVDGSGAIEGTDASRIVNHVLRAELIPDNMLQYADVDGNGDIEGSDATRIVNHVLGTETIGE